MCQDWKSYYSRLFYLRAVCTQWRNLIDQLSDLWTIYSNQYSPELQRKIFALSGNRPLTVHLSANHWSVTMDLVLKNVELWDYLSVTYPPHFKVGSPRIHSLSLHSTYQKVPVVHFLYSSFLQEVSLINVRARWEGTCLGPLAGLRVLRLIALMDGPPSIRRILQIISASPNLLILEASDFAFTEERDEILKHVPLPVVSLPKLKELHLKVIPFSLALLFLRHVVLNSDCHIAISGVDYSSPHGQRTLGMQDYNAPSDPWMVYPPQLELFSNRNCQSTIVYRGVSVTFRHSCSELLPALNDVGTLFKYLPPKIRDEATSLRISGPADWDKAREILDFTDTLFPNITHIEVVYMFTSIDRALDLLKAPMTRPDGSCRWLFPRMTSLTVRAADIHLRIFDTVNELVQARVTNLGTFDVDVEPPKTLESLWLNGITLDETRIQELRSLVPYLDVTPPKLWDDD
ncbi:hypothetical protein FRB99_000719 [Tulasnella sp. 403]|nr:hypothetical protein FRB99_000719 [Tulasnella sp. 403]